MNLNNNKAVSLGKVTMRDEFLQNAFEKEVMYLTSFDTDKLLAGFRETAGVDQRGATRYEGWESMLIGGHTLGHYISACVHSCESANCREEDREELLMILKRLTDGLAECQEKAQTGFLFGAIILDPANVEQQFDSVEENKTNIITQAWVPWYTMHKTLEGLVSLCNMEVEGALAESIRDMARQVISRLADWVYHRTAGWDESTHRTVLGIEYGGMNDCMYDVYRITGKAEHLTAAHAFDQTELFERVLQAKAGDHVLNNHHANTTIPKFLGALNRYAVTGETRYLEYVIRFWELVTMHHSYITGGNSEWEHFGEDRILDKERTNCNCETCNVYNMQKMTKKLYEITGDVRYADWYERTYINSILSSQHPETGMTTYFQPMASGYYKVFGERFNKFWCCTGTGMENFSKLQEAFYFENGNTLIINQYISSSVKFRGVTIVQETVLPEKDSSTFRMEAGFEGNLLFRLPYWLAEDASIRINGKECGYSTMHKNGYALVEGPFAPGTELVITLPMKVMMMNLPDGENTYGFQYGPVVLSALLGTENMVDATTGVNVTIPSNRIIGKQYIPSGKETIVVETGSVEAYMEQIDRYLVRQGEELCFTLTGTDANLTYVPHYRQYKERYGIYFTFTDKKQMEGETTDYRARRIDTVQPGYGQYENDGLHNMTEGGTGSVGTTHGGTSRYAKEGGSFSYTMEVHPEGCGLLAVFCKTDAGKSIRITTGDVLVYEGVLEEREEEFYEVLIPVPEKALELSQKRFYDCRERKVLTFTFAGTDGKESAALCQFLYTVRC